MKISIDVIATELQWEADEYRKQYDSIKAARARELKEAEDTYKPGSMKLLERIAQVNSVCDSSLAKLKNDIVDRTLGDIEELRKQELDRVQAINEPLLAKIRAIADVPMTTLELSAFAKKVNAKGDYWAGRMLANIAEQNGINAAEIGIESTYDTKMAVLDELTEQLDKLLKFYGTKDPAERSKVKYVYLSESIIARAIQMYGGKLSKMSDGQIANKAYLAVKVQQTDIQKGIAISNVLRNARGEVKNKILCLLAEDNSISNMAADISGHMEEIEYFKSGKAAEYRQAERAIREMREIRDIAVINQRAAQYEDNIFFKSLFEQEKKQNPSFARMTDEDKEPEQDDSITE